MDDALDNKKPIREYIEQTAHQAGKRGGVSVNIMSQNGIEIISTSSSSSPQGVSHIQYINSAGGIQRAATAAQGAAAGQSDASGSQSPRPFGPQPPPNEHSPLDGIRYTWGQSNTLLQFLVTFICLMCGTAVISLCFAAALPFISLAKIIIGSMYIHDCPAQSMIPIYLIVDGVFFTFLQIFCNNPKSCLETTLEIFLIAWLIAGTVWVYSIYEPEYQIQTMGNYCHKTLYLFAFWYLNLTYLIIILFSFVCICAVCIGLASEESQ